MSKLKSVKGWLLIYGCLALDVLPYWDGRRLRWWSDLGCRHGIANKGFKLVDES